MKFADTGDKAIPAYCVEQDIIFEKSKTFDTITKGGATSDIFDPKTCHGHHGYTGTSFWFEASSGNFVILLTNRNHPIESERDFRPIRKQCFNKMWEEWKNKE